MIKVMRVDAPEQIRRRYENVEGSGYGGYVALSALLAFGGVIAMIIQGVGHSPIGFAVCALATLFGVVGVRKATRVHRDIQRWLQPIEIGHTYITFAHGAYWKLTPETRASYGLPLVKRMYELSMVDVRGRTAIQGVEAQMMNRWYALNDLVDAEDKQRLYSADPLLADRDDVDAAQIWQRAVERAVTCLQDDELSSGR